MASDKDIIIIGGGGGRSSEPLLDLKLKVKDITQAQIDAIVAAAVAISGGTVKEE